VVRVYFNHQFTLAATYTKKLPIMAHFDYHFVPIAVETFGTWGSIGHKFITDIGRTIAEITKNPKSTSFIFQAISMAV